MAEQIHKKFKVSVIGSVDESFEKTLHERLGNCCEISFHIEQSEYVKGADLIVLVHQSEIYLKPDCPVINVHPSLLPSFACVDALSKSFLSGIKVGGITVHKVENNNFWGQIIAQYPVLIGLNTHFDEFEAEILSIEKALLPNVIDAVLNDRVFDYTDLFNRSCRCNSGGCSGNCADCRH